MATLTEDIVGGRGYGFGGFGGDGAGGLGGGLLLGLLLGRGGLGGFGNDWRGGGDCRDCVTNESLNQQTLGDIKASVPLSEGQIQLALAQAVSSLTGQNNANTQALLVNQFGLDKSIAAVDTNVDRTGTMLLAAIKDDGEKTRTLITSNQIAELNQKLTVAQLDGAEQRAINRETVNSHNVTVQVNQQQAQAQLQFQAINNALTALCNGFSQVARATNSQVVVGSTGVAGTQTANPTNVAA